jgi:hypothetical protein
MAYKPRNTLTIGNRTYDLNVTDQQFQYSYVHIVRIEDENGNQVTSARIYGDWDTVHKTAKGWWMRLLAANPGKLLQMTMETATSDMCQ